MNFFFYKITLFILTSIYRLHFLFNKKASIQILEAILYKQQGHSDKPRPCNYELFIVFLLQMLIVNLVSGY